MGNNSYLSEAWNWLDFIVVVTSLLEQLPGMNGVSGLRTFRLFRPLRSLTTMPSMKLLIGTLMASVAQLGGIMGLASFFFAIFAILGISLLDGKTHWRCYETQEPLADGTWIFDPDNTRLCDKDFLQCPKGTYCGSRYDIYYNTDNKYKWEVDLLGQDTDIYELNYNLTNFDDIVTAFLTIF